MRHQTVFIGMTPTLRLRIETTIENLLLLLDEIDGDENLEPDHAGFDHRFMDDREEDHELELDNCDDEDGHDAEPDQCDGETVTWENDLMSQEVLVSLG